MKNIVFTFLLLIPAFCLQAQQPCTDLYAASDQETPQQKTTPSRPTQDEIESRKIAYLSSAIDLTPAEAAHFWPVYNSWSKKTEDNMKMRHTALKKIRQFVKDGGTDEKAYAQQTKILIDGAAEEAQIIAEAHQAYTAILGEVRTAKLYLAEEQFRGLLIRELRQGASNKDSKK